MKVLFVVEGYTDIRYVTGLSEICDLTLLTPAKHFRNSGLADRLRESGACITVKELGGDRLQYQVRSGAYLWRNAGRFDCILVQELLRGALSGCLMASIHRTPVIATVCMPAVDYYRCRRLRGQFGSLKAFAGEALIRSLQTINGKLVNRCLALGPYLVDYASRYCGHVSKALYYGVDTSLYHPVSLSARKVLRAKLELPPGKFIVFLASRISHEKDPETVARATALARAKGLDAVLINLGGGHQKFLAMTRELGLPETESWVLGRPAAHPMRDLPAYYQASDVLAQASLAEGAGMAPLEALACGVPAVCTAVGGLARILPGYARLVPSADPEAMAREFLSIAQSPREAREQALHGRAHVHAEWSRRKAFDDLRHDLMEACLGRSR